jgi:small subunit ribosomal protein S21
MKVIVHDGRSLESALRKFKKKVNDSGLLQEIRDREFYEKPTTTRKIQSARARSRWNKYLRSQELPKKLF